MKTLLSIICLSIALLGLTACHTVAGFGQDLQQGGKALQRKANK